MSRRTLAFVVIALLASLGFVRLGVWQLSRLGERRARNAEVLANMQAPAAAVREVLRLGDSARYRPVVARGRFDYDQELVFVARSRSGSPGVYLLTPLRAPESDSAVLVIRGWVYSPDGRTVDLARWREADEGSVTGYVDEFGTGAGPVSLPGQSRALRRLDLDSSARACRTRSPRA
jgi:surfeit locus 1 family protein